MEKIGFSFFCTNKIDKSLYWSLSHVVRSRSFARACKEGVTRCSNILYFSPLGLNFLLE